jgi:hypothetical protein
MFDQDSNAAAAQAQSGLAQEAAPSLSDLAAPEEGAGAWPKGWFRAVILPGYTTGKGTTFETSDKLARDPGSRNLFICLEVSGDVYIPSSPDPAARKLSPGPGGKRNIRATFNYNPNDLTAARIALIKEARERYKAVQGAWPDKAIQASSLSLGRLGQLEKAVGFQLPFVGGRYNPAPFVGQRVDVRLSIDDKGFSDVAAVAPAGSHVK